MTTRRLTLHSFAHVLPCALLASCTLVTGAGDYEVDPVKEQQVRDQEAMSKQRSLDYDFLAMSPHALQTLDVALVNSDNVQQARARIVLPPVPKDDQGKPVLADYPAQNLPLDSALLPGPHQLYFFVDTDGDFEVDGMDESESGFEHQWIKPVDPDGGGSFSHSFMFQLFQDGDFNAPNQTLVLKAPAIPADVLQNDDVRECVITAVSNKFEDTLEVRVFAALEDRQVGYYRLGKGALSSSTNADVELRGVVDAGNVYRVESLVDGDLTNSEEVMAPQRGPLEIAAAKWFPFASSLGDIVTDCLAPVDGPPGN